MLKYKNVSNKILHQNMTILAFALLIFVYIMKSKSSYATFYNYVTLVKYEGRSLLREGHVVLPWLRY